MKKSAKGLFILAFLLALIGAGAFYLYLSQLEQPTLVEPDMGSVLVATVEIPARTLITDEMVERIEIPASAILTGGFTTPDEVVGQYSRTSIYQQQQIHPNALIGDIGEELSMKITGSNRAMTLNVSGSTGVSKLIKPGDRVDVIVFLPQIMEQNRIIRPDIAKILLQNIEVLAIDQTLHREEPSNIPVSDSEGQIASYFVTLSVPITEVESLILAKDIGVIDLALRPLEDDNLYVTNGIIWQELLLNDSKQLKDFFPEYEFEGLEESAFGQDEFVYSQYLYYTVRFGDTLQSISNAFYGSPTYVDLLKQVNKIEDENLILSGTGIKIPVLEESEGADAN